MFAELLKVALSVFKKAICIFDDIPFLLKGIGVLTGLFTLIGAGYLIFGVQLYNAITELVKTYEEDKNSRSIVTGILQVIFAVMGLVLTTGLLALTGIGLIFAIKSLLVIASALSAVIPLIMAVAAGIELLEAIDKWTDAPEHSAEEDEAKTETLYCILYFGLALAVTALATVTVILGPGIPTYILIGVIGVSVGLKLYEEREAIWNALVSMANAIEEKLNEVNDAIEQRIDNFICWITNQPTQEIQITSTLARLSKGDLKKSTSGESLGNLKDSHSDTSLETEPMPTIVIPRIETPSITPQQSLNDDEYQGCVFFCAK